MVDTTDTIQVKRYTEAHLKEIRGREDVATALGLELEALRRAFLRREGLTLADYIRRERVYRAKQLLRETAMSNKQVCEAVGFTRRDGGERTFREIAGESMQVYRSGYLARYRRRAG